MSRQFPTAPPDGLIAAVLLAFLGTAGLFYVNIMAALVDGLQQGLHFSARDAGFVAAANVYGAAAGALSAVFFVARSPWRKVALAALLILIAIDLVSTRVLTPTLLICARFAHGLVGGFLVGTAFAVIARTRTPDRVFGMLLVVQFGFGGIGLAVLPRLVAAFGTPVLFLALALFSLVTLLLLPFLDAYPRRPIEAERAGGPNKTRRAPLMAALLSVFLFQAANMGLAAYVIGLGRTFGLGANVISGTLGVANWISAFGSVAVVVLGLRYGRTAPLTLGLVAAIAGTALFLLSGQVWAYAAANVISGVAWSMVIAYLLGLCAACDDGGRSAALAGFFSKMGLATGPALAAVLLQETHYKRLVILALAGLALTLVAAFRPARELDHRVS
ncbi:MAG TPA: MFS transporter [Caulobacteraceae bacterium]|jgi:predicted MFS family arabinose efflux permease